MDFNNCLHVHGESILSLQSNIHPSDFTSDGNLMAKVFKRLLSEACFIEIVQVQSVQEHTCTIKPLLAKQDPSGAKIETIEVSGIPFFRLQMGTSAIKINPKAGDIGLLLCCDRDITNILTTKAESMVATGFTHSKKDGIYLGGIELLNSEPTEYIEFTGNGINIVASALNIQAPVTMTSTLDVSGATSIEGVDFVGHTHSGVQSGGANTGGVVT